MSQGGGLKKVIVANDDQHEVNGPLLHPQECSSLEKVDTLQASSSSFKQVDNSQFEQSIPLKQQPQPLVLKETFQ